MEVHKKKVKNFWKFSLIILVLICLITAIYLSHDSLKKIDTTDMKYKKVLVIGIDGMDPKITSQLIAEGKLPNFKKLAEDGTYSSLATSMPPHSPVSWTTIATGVNPGKHNIFDFIRREVGSYIPELSLAKTKSTIAGTDYLPYVSSKPFYKITSENNIPTDIIRWPVSFPPEEINGNLLAGLGVPDVRGMLSGYTYYTSSKIKEDSKQKIVEFNSDGIVLTKLDGPKTVKSGKLTALEIPLQIKISSDKNSAELEFNNKKYSIKKGEWSEWLTAEFKTGIFKRSSTIFQVYLINSDPKNFEMYLTTMQIDPRNPIAAISYPDDYSKDLAKEIGLYYTLGMPEETDGYVDGKIDADAFLTQVQEIESERDKMFWKEFTDFKKSSKDSAQLLAFVYDSSDRMQHVFWNQKFLDGSYKLGDKIKINPAVEKYWIAKDKFIGEVIGNITSDTLLLVVSDHGFTSFEEAVSVNTWFVKNGFMTVNGELSDENENALFQGVNWAKTQAYSLGFNSIYLNVKGREPQGTIDEKDKDKVMDTIIVKLEALTDEKGNKAINKVYKASEIYSGKELVNAPDLIIGYNPGFRMAWQTAIGGFSKEIILKNTKVWSGDHLIDSKFVPGVIFSNQKLIINVNSSQLDVAPTILDAFGINIPSDFDGKSLLK